MISWTNLFFFFFLLGWFIVLNFHMQSLTTLAGSGWVLDHDRFNNNNDMIMIFL